MRRAVAALLVPALVLPGCRGPANEGTGPDGVRVVTTVAPIADLVRRVAGGTAEVVALVPDGVDSHTFEPDPAQAADLAGARLFVANGLGLEEPSIRLAQANLPEGASIVRLGDDTVPPEEWVFDRSFPEAGGVPNPHAWLDVPRAIRYVERIAQAVAGVVAEDDRAQVRRNARALAAELTALHEAVETAVATVPARNRKLLTYHDSWAYFGRRYGFTVVDAVQPAGMSEPSAAEVREVIDQIRAQGVPAVFGSEVFDDEVLRAIARETGVRFVGDLADDALPGEPGDPEHSYVGMMARNVRTVVEALGGDASALDRLSGVHQ
ncbi:MAG TPA: metal ABC transporter substrate-binding protein [Egibacteraceae bacterium]|nr:metal ABC transporter substrate-binding protein [Egibacteraceae bacterium]